MNLTISKFLISHLFFLYGKPLNCGLILPLHTTYPLNFIALSQPGTATLCKL